MEHPQEAAGQKAPVVAEVVDEFEDRVDEYTLSLFRALGYDGRLPDGIVTACRAYKLTKDRLAPGRMTPSDVAFVVTLVDVATGKLVLTKE